MGKTLVGFETILALPAVEINGVPWIATPTGLVDYENPTTAALNLFQGITRPSQVNAAQGGNISCAIEDDLSLGQTGSDTDSGKTICSKGNSETLTLYNFEASLNARKDANPTADSLLNLFRDLTRLPDVPYFLAHRVRGQKDSTETFAIGDEVDLYYVHTNVQIPDYGDGNPIKLGSAFLPKGILNVGHVLTV